MDNKSYTTATATTTTASFEEDKDDGASFHPPKTHDDEYGGSIGGGGRLPRKKSGLKSNLRSSFRRTSSTTSFRSSFTNSSFGSLYSLGGGGMKSSGHGGTTTSISYSLGQSSHHNDNTGLHLSGHPTAESPPPTLSMFDDNDNLLDDSSHSDSDSDINSSSNALIAKLSSQPSPEELLNVAAIRVDEILQDYTSDNELCENFTALPQYTKSDLLIGKHLGKGSFSDVFEVIATVTEVDQSSSSSAAAAAATARRQSLSKQLLDNSDDLDRLIEAKFGGGGEEKSNEDWDDIDSSGRSQEEDDDVFALPMSSTFDDVKDEKKDEDERSEFKPSPIRLRGGPRRRATASSGLSHSMSMATFTTIQSRRTDSRRISLAMKCLRPQIRSNTEQFMIGVEDLVHETVMLSSLDHPNIIKIHGRANDCISRSSSESVRLSDGYFILLDKLQDNLDDRIVEWRKKYPNSSKHPPSMSRVKVATAVADAMSFLHERNIAFRDLKPANVGFDGKGVVKLFDFGFAISMGSDNDLLYDRAGTIRYMAPEVGLDMGYGLSADVYSFSILLWELFALKKPFSKMKCASDFIKTVFQKGERPTPGKNWQPEIKELLKDSWSSNPNGRPSMKDIIRSLQHLQHQTLTSSASQDDLPSLRRSVLNKFSSTDNLRRL